MAQQPRFSPLTAPAINLNGDTADQLVNEIIGMRSACFDLMKLMRGTAICHPRNFQTVPRSKEVTAKAQAAWDQRVQFLLNFYAELQEIGDAIIKQRDGEPKEPHPTIQ